MGAAGEGEVFPGARVDSEDPRYPTLVQGFNPRWVAAPEYVQVCGDTGQVVQAVQEACANEQRITVRGGGHCYEDFVCDNEGGVLIDLAPMDGIYRGAAGEKLYCVEGGATLWNVYNELYRQFGVTLPGGSCYSVGVGGHVTGGGYGLLSRLHGLTVDYLAGVEVVRVNAAGQAEAITVFRDSSEDEAREIAWAHTGGGGGNFGIVTKFFFADLPQAPRQAVLSSLAWDWEELNEEEFGQLVSLYGRFFAENSAPGSEFSPLFSLLHLTQYSSSSSQIVLTTQIAEPEAPLLREFTEHVCAGLPSPQAQRAGGAPAGAAGGPAGPRLLPWLFATQALNGDTPNQRGKYKSAYMIESFSDDQIATMWKYLREQPNPKAKQALLQVDSYGCQVNAVAPDATAVPQRSSTLKLQYQTYWLEAAEDEANLAWIRAFYEEMYGPRGPWPDGAVDGCFVNYPDVDLKEWQYLYYKEGYARLQGAKKLCDPHDVFSHQQSIELP
jgi:FAD/FMN-containing dehydrogenase